MATTVTTPFQNVSIPAGASQTYQVDGSPENYYAFSISNALSVNSATQAILLVTNGCTSISGGRQAPSPWCVVTNNGSTEASFDLVLLTVTN